MKNSLFVLFICSITASFAQTPVLKKGSVLDYKMYTFSGEYDLSVRIKNLAPDLSYAWNIIDFSGKIVDSGMFRVSAYDMVNATNIWMNFDKSVTSKDSSCSIWISKKLNDQLKKLVNQADSTITMTVNGSRNIRLGQITYATDDVAFQNLMLYNTKTIFLAETYVENGFLQVNPDKTTIRFLYNDNCPVISYFQSPDGNFQLLLQSVSNVDLK